MIFSDRAIVVRFTPQLKLMVVVGLLLIIIGIVASYIVGVNNGLGAAAQAERENVLLQERVASLEETLRTHQQRTVRAEKAAEIDQMAAEAVRQELSNYRQEVSALQSDVEFYRSLMAPEELQRGLSVHLFKLVYDEINELYRYSVLMTQAGGRNQVIKGSLTLMITVKGSAKARKVSMASMPGFEGELPAKLRFRFFQKIEGAFKLPEEERPVSIALEAKSIGKSPQQINKTFTWHELVGDN